MFSPNLNPIDEEDYDKVKQRILVSSTVALILYASLTGWRYESTERLKAGKLAIG